MEGRKLMSEFRLTIEKALYIEKELNKVFFNGVPSGALFSELIYASMYFTSFKFSLRQHVKNIIQYQYLKQLKTGADIIDAQAIQGKYIFNYVSNTARLTDFFKPLLPLLKETEVAFSANPEQKNTEWSAYPFFTFYGLNKQDHATWARHYHQFKTAFHQTLKTLRNETGSNAQIESVFKITSVIQTKRLQYFLTQFEKHKPKAILTDHDKHAFNSALILAAGKLGIPTYTMVHGSTQPLDFYVPLVAKKVLCWGDVQKNQFIDAGVPATKIIVAGNQKLQRTFNLDVKQFRIKSGFGTDGNNMTILSNPIEHSEKIRFVSDIINASGGKFNILLRIHPSENKNDYAPLYTIYPELKCLDQSEQTFEETLACSDLVICHNSIAAFETIIKNIPLIIYNPSYISFPLGIGEELHEKGGFPIVNTKDELLNYLEAEEYRNNEFDQKKESFIHSYIYAFGEDAARNITNELSNPVSI